MADPIYITHTDKEKLSKLIEESKHSDTKNDIYLKKLEAEINRAVIKPESQIPTNIVTMDSNVLLVVDGSEEEATLVYPKHANVLKNKISVLSPLGTAILGYKEGSTIEWEVPNGKVEIYVKKVTHAG